MKLKSIFKISLIIVFSFLISSCGHLFYYPDQKTIFFDPSKMGLEYEDIFFQNHENKKMHAWWFPSKKSKATIIFFHGNAQNLTSHFAYLSWLVQKDYNLFIFDYPGYGQSEGEPNPHDNVQTGIKAIEWVVANKDSRPLVVYGASLGGNIAMRTAYELKEKNYIGALIADSTFPSYQNIGKKKLSYSWITWLFQPLAYVLVSDRWAIDNRLSKIPSYPKLVVHGQKDTVVEPEFGDEIFKNFSESKTMISIPEGLHTDAYFAHDLIYRQQLLSWLDFALKR
jgi:fermentation-respiration switch protein FrsA (DUF1100 family)